ncbi:hypothetical protein NA8A_10078 [Nitratireductor indicus C115]|uniref:Uncharacterized protein n=1 Tax=Nitratireductor indicus C115 TaxID=1231190 RepID=K2P4V5_9HYPH|nr:hypothetical protein NA8A_10078 [Nitratireductor indicus C115]
MLHLAFQDFVLENRASDWPREEGIATLAGCEFQRQEKDFRLRLKITPKVGSAKLSYASCA